MNKNIRIAKQLIRIAKMLVSASSKKASVYTMDTFSTMTDDDFYTDYIEDNIDNYMEFEEYFKQYTSAIKEYAENLVEEEGYDMDDAAGKAIMDFGENCGYAVMGQKSSYEVAEYANAMRQIARANSI